MRIQLSLTKMDCYLQSLKGEGTPHLEGPHRKHQVQPGSRRSEGKAWAQACIMVSIGKARQSRVSKFRIG